MLRILSESLQGFSRYSLISGIVSILLFFFLHLVNHLNLGSPSPVTANCPNIMIGAPLARWAGVQHYQPLWETGRKHLVQRHVSTTFQLWSDQWRREHMSPFESSDGDWLRMHRRQGLVIVINTTFLSQPFQMYLFLQTTVQNTCSQLVTFSSRLLLGYPNNTPVFFCSAQSCSHHFHKLFTKWHIESSCSKKRSRALQNTSWSLYWSP